MFKQGITRLCSCPLSEAGAAPAGAGMRDGMRAGCSELRRALGAILQCSCQHSTVLLQWHNSRQHRVEGCLCSFASPNAALDTHGPDGPCPVLPRRQPHGLYQGCSQCNVSCVVLLAPDVRGTAAERLNLRTDIPLHSVGAAVMGGVGGNGRRTRSAPSRPLR